jgi:uncharacterized protein
VSNRLPSREQALKLLHDTKCPSKVIAHCGGVAKLARKTAETCRKKGLEVDVDLVEIGAILHDIGRSKTHSVNHAIAGAEIAKLNGLPVQVVCIIERHVGGGITNAEAKKLGWPKGNYCPETLEEKIVSYADKLVETHEYVPVEFTIERLREEKRYAAAERVIKLHNEIANLVGKVV